MDSFKLPCNYVLSFLRHGGGSCFHPWFIRGCRACPLVGSLRGLCPSTPTVWPYHHPLGVWGPSPLGIWGFWGFAPAVSLPQGFGCRQQVGFPMFGVPRTPAQLGPWWFSCCFCFRLSLSPLLWLGGLAGWLGWLAVWVSTTLLGHLGLARLAGGPLAGLWWALHKPAPLTLRCVDPFSPLGVPRRFLGPHPFTNPSYPSPFPPP